MRNNIIQRVINNKNNYRYIAASVFIVIAGIIYSISRLLSNSSDDIAYEYDASTRPSVEESTTASSESTIQDKNIFAYICGAVVNPGVYKVADGTRIYEAVELAGGYVDGADISTVNLADKVLDGQKIYIPTEGEDVHEQASASSSGVASKVNINTASESELTTLPGIGESRAKDIVNYRMKNGSFNSIDDIKNVTGIKDAAFEKIKDYIRV